jgi:hypothetical protein
MLADELPRWPWGAPGVGGGGGEREAACADPPVPDPVGWDCPACGPCALPERCWFEWIAGRGGNGVGVGGGGRRACACWCWPWWCEDDGPPGTPLWGWPSRWEELLPAPLCAGGAWGLSRGSSSTMPQRPWPSTTSSTYLCELSVIFQYCGSRGTRGGAPEGHNGRFRSVLINSGAGAIYIGIRLCQTRASSWLRPEAGKEGDTEAGTDVGRVRGRERGLRRDCRLFKICYLLSKAKQTFQHPEEAVTCAGELCVFQWVSGSPS